MANILYYAIARDLEVYKFDFFGDAVTTTVTSNPSVIAGWIERANIELRYIADRCVVGMAVQWRPYTGTTTAATLQLAVGQQCLIIQLVHCQDIPYILRDFFYEDYTFVGMWNRHDAWRLWHTDHWLHFGERPPVDLRHRVVMDDGQRLHRKSIETIVTETLGWYGVRFDKDISMSDWEVRRLSALQVWQATADAYASCMIGHAYFFYR